MNPAACIRRWMRRGPAGIGRIHSAQQQPSAERADQAARKVFCEGCVTTARSQSPDRAAEGATVPREINSTARASEPVAKQMLRSGRGLGSRKRQSTRRSSRLRTDSGG